MSFFITLKKNDEGSYDVEASMPDTLPETSIISGHVDESGQVVDLNARANGLNASASRREYPV